MSQADSPTSDQSRRHVTVLFADLADYTPLSESLGEEATFLLLKRVMARLIGEVDEHGGTVQDLAGDGILAVFGAPRALEDAPLRACRTALGMQQGIAELAAETELESGLQLRLRVGINSGPVILGELNREWKVVGDTVNTAARIQTLADPGHVMLSDATYRLVAPYVEASDAGMRSLKGKSQPQRTWAVESLKETMTRFDAQVERGLTPFVNRDQELSLLETHWQEARSGSMRLIDVAGEAGMGKSRLIHSFRESATGDDAVFLGGHCSAEGGHSPFLPFVEIVKKSFGLIGLNDSAAVQTSLTEGLAALELPPGDHWPYLANLVGADTGGALAAVDSEAVGVRTRASLRTVLQQNCRRQPTVLYVEDLHWIDSESEAVVAGLIESCADQRLMIIATRRPEYRPPWLPEPSPSDERARVASIPLTPLSGEHSAELATGRLGMAGVDSELRQVLVERTGGNPLFVEELASFLLASGHIESERASDPAAPGANAGETFASLALPTDDVSASVPASLEGLLLERIDHLDDAERNALRVASVIGRQFEVTLVQEIAAIDDPVAVLQGLEAQDVVFSSADGSRFTFKHALIQDVIYGSLLTDDRARLHLEIAGALERRHGVEASEAVDDLAHHYSKTGEVAKELHYLYLSAQRSHQLFALGVVEQRLRKALALIEANPGAVDDALVLDVLLLLARLLTDEGDAGLIAEVFEPYRELAEKADRERRGRFYVLLGFSLSVTGQPVQGKELLVQALALAEEHDDPAARAQASLWMAMHYAYWSDPEVEARSELETHAECGHDNAAEIRDGWTQAYCLYTLATNSIGTPGRCRVAIERLHELDRSGDEPLARQIALAMGAWLDLSSGDAASAVAKAAQAEELTLAGNQLYITRTIRGLGWAMEGRTVEGLALLQEVWQKSHESRNICNHLVLDGILGVGLLLDGQYGRATRWLDERYEAYRHTGARALHLGFLRLYLGEAYLGIALGEQRPSFSGIVKNLGFLVKTIPFARRKARRALEEALALFETEDARGAIARAQLDLGLLANAEGRAEQARAFLERALEGAEIAAATDIRDRTRQALEGLGA